MAKERASSSTTPLDGTQEREYQCQKCRDDNIIAVITETGEEVRIGDTKLFDFTNNRVVPHTTRECTCVDRKRITKLFRSSHITEEFQKLGFKNYTVEGRPQCVGQAYDCAAGYFRNFHEISESRHNSILLLGPPGGGKTHLLMAVSNNLMSKGVGVMYFPWVEGFGDLKDNLDDLERKIGLMKRVDVLFIDDLFKGRRKPTEFQVEQLFAVVNYRYLEHLPVMVSSERSLNDICEIDEGIGSRIREMAKGYTVHMRLTDYEADEGMELNYRLM